MDRLSSISTRLVNRYGGSASLTRTSTNGTPYAPDTEDTLHAVQLVETGATDAYRSQGLIEGNELFAIMLPPDGVTPEPGDKLTTDAGTFVLLEVEPVRSDPNGEPLHFRIQGRR